MSEGVASVPRMGRVVARGAVDRDAEAHAWLRALRDRGPEREAAAAELHALLLRAARFELLRRRGMLRDASAQAIDDLATESADDALSALLGKLDDYRFQSRFTTWAYKFAILEAAVRARRRAWQNRELSIDSDAWASLPARADDVPDALGTRERLEAIIAAVRTDLSPHQREVLCALVVADVPIDVLADRLNTTRGALYKTLHDARRKLRAAVGDDDD